MFSFRDSVWQAIWAVNVKFSLAAHAVFTKERVSRSRKGQPKTICAEEILQSRSAVVHSCNMACKSQSLSRRPVGPVLNAKRRVAVLTATSARPFDMGETCK